jgi:N-acyl-L-homoserine lactone synthetase
VSKPWYLVNAKIAGKWMFIPPNIARLVLIHPHMMIHAEESNTPTFWESSRFKKALGAWM